MLQFTQGSCHAAGSASSFYHQLPLPAKPTEAFFPHCCTANDQYVLPLTATTPCATAAICMCCTALYDFHCIAKVLTACVRFCLLDHRTTTPHHTTPHILITCGKLSAPTSCAQTIVIRPPFSCCAADTMLTTCFVAVRRAPRPSGLGLVLHASLQVIQLRPLTAGALCQCCQHTSAMLSNRLSKHCYATVMRLPSVATVLASRLLRWCVCHTMHSTCSAVAAAGAVC